MTQISRDIAAQDGLPDLPLAITSFGAAILDDFLYIHGGHHGTAHHYSQAGQSDKFWRLNLSHPDQWEELGTGQRLQGHAFFAHGGWLYRVGGFEARNPEGEEQDLWSVADFARFDPNSNTWQDLPPLPSARSSFDAAMLGDMLYVVGGWELRGADDAVWPAAAFTLNLAEEPFCWREIPAPPFRRRALSVGCIGDLVYVIGGMCQEGKVTSETAVYSPSTETWTAGPALPEGEMEGFGTACCTDNGILFVSTISGRLLKLNADGSGWEQITTMPEPRFFHRMLPLDNATLMLIGGASMRAGKFASIRTVSSS